ncbi:MAG: DUF547 domain-containing protein [Crocinitomicaceae bacterium]
MKKNISNFLLIAFLAFSSADNKANATIQNTWTGIRTENVLSKRPEQIRIVDKLETNSQADHSGAYAELLSKYVSSAGKVNYAGIKKNAAKLDQAIAYFKDNTPQGDWSNSKKLAYWINAYNLFTIKLIIDNYPVTSIKNIAGGKPWDKKFIQLDGKTMSLNDIENGIIRKQFNEPRIHFAVNCASISCPKLANEEYTSSNLNTLLDKQAKRYINDVNENSFSGKTVQISSIFDWYQGDFTGGIIPFLNKFSNSKIPSDAKITYKEYNWNLNN